MASRKAATDSAKITRSASERAKACRAKERVKARKRVAVAKDVLRQLAAEAFTATTGHYLKLEETVHVDEDADISEVLEGKTCEACAKGSLLLGHIAKFGHVKASDIFGTYQGECSAYNAHHDSTIAPLLKYFSRDQLDLIEAAFERGETPFAPSHALSDKAVRFGKRYPSPAGRLRAILKNMIANGGTFVP